MFCKVCSFHGIYVHCNFNLFVTVLEGAQLICNCIIYNVHCSCNLFIPVLKEAQLIFSCIIRNLHCNCNVFVIVFVHVFVGWSAVNL